MRWKGRKQSSNVDDRRGRRMLGGTKGKFGIGTIIVILIAMYFGQDPMQILQQVNTGASPQRTEQDADTENDELAQFVAVVLQDTEDVWNKIFAEELNRDYKEPTLVLFTGSVNSACGSASAATGPFYCSADEKLYIDLSFYQDLKERFGAPGDFAMAYVVAHEVAHHVQNELGLTDKVHSQRSSLSQEEYNKLSVKLELQADFFSGVWANHAQEMKNILEEGDIEEALQAANAIGDDRLQMQAQGYVVPESFTHGTSAQRVSWFKKGYTTGDIQQGDTFNSSAL
ncbi:KPN_02809 family neutral zinc metallopeptidase [Chondrinema litorale]|uniref:KPN_02809 family neutral zinc metallopeptidase n=1 Tax=Chondrinema litorale TaxID=2994555 RepID=UPI002543301C|nr:neutral zinc metallopeptidase [Chondrinema litorale]UZR97889.1 zinc metallopeptidase [Chondrinema litorale]